MPTEFKIPELGENVTSGDVVRVLVKPGDTVAKDQPILELETDKATIEVPSTIAGTVKEVTVKQGQKVNVGQVVLTVDGGAAEPAKAEGEAPKAAQAEQQPEEKQPRATAEAKAEATDKPKPQPTGAPEEGGLSQQATARDAGDEEETGPAKPKRGEVVDITRGARAPAAASAASPLPEPAEPQGPAIAAAPSIRRLARELGIDIRRVQGTGPAGRISSDDVQAFVRGALAPPQAGVASAPFPELSRWGEVERQPMSNIRRKTAEHLSHAWSVIPHVTQHDRADITALEALRKQYAPQAEKAGGKLTMTAIALKIVAVALRKFPNFNSSLDMARGELVYRKSVHVGVAADTERGLLVPVIRDVDRKGIVELSTELAKLSAKARAGKLSLDEMQGGGFTITNLGGIGGTAFTPIVNWPEVAILGISRASHEPVYINQQFEPRLMLPLSLSYDHRVIDGADAARFLRWVAEAFEQPFMLAL
jgi:pyruvate dehydrogenase E2 component (dihydrolipoamide acetyltransferase)